MFTPPKFRRPAPAVLLGLELLGLLLWGQCAFWRPYYYNLPAKVFFFPQVDSLTTVGPTVTLYLTFRIHNRLRQAVTLDSLRGNLSFRNYKWTFSATDQLNRLALRANQKQFISVAIPLSAMPSDSLALLRAALREGTTIANSLRLPARLIYSRDTAPTILKTTSYDYLLPMRERKKRTN